MISGAFRGWRLLDRKKETPLCGSKWNHKGELLMAIHLNSKILAFTGPRFINSPNAS